MPYVLSVRKGNESVGREVKDLGTAHARTSPRLVILIHGYNTTEEEAGNAYGKFAELLAAASRRGTAELGSIWELHWPGDHPAGGALSALTFDGKIRAARISGELFARKWLRKRRGQRVILIGHSLGCRVALETVQWILEEAEEYEGATIEAVFLLAPAVPVPLCVRGETFSTGVADSLEHVFFSRSDGVLRSAFGPGSYLAGEGGPAVGRDGLPEARWHGRHDTGLGHGDYWGNREVAERVAEVLGVNEQRTRDSRRLATWKPFERRPGFFRRLANRVVGGP